MRGVRQILSDPVGDWRPRLPPEIAHASARTPMAPQRGFHTSDTHRHHPRSTVSPDQPQGASPRFHSKPRQGPRHVAWGFNRFQPQETGRRSRDLPATRTPSNITNATGDRAPIAAHPQAN